MAVFGCVLIIMAVLDNDISPIIIVLYNYIIIQYGVVDSSPIAPPTHQTEDNPADRHCNHHVAPLGVRLGVDVAVANGRHGHQRPVVACDIPVPAVCIGFPSEIAHDPSAREISLGIHQGATLTIVITKVVPRTR